ncbi:MAG: Gfo/Idh/MocA family oxidoreductase [Armatimonadetes bacterium]|nr:Gfo/Idh/MocA family oxidoreductase [Armatimonadota bacterium]
MSNVRIGMIGCGGMARAHMNQLSEVPEAEIVALNDPDEGQIAACRARFPHLANVPVFKDYRDMIAAGGLDAVEINTPHTQHKQQMLDSFAAGLHVLCDKPLVTVAAEAAEVIAARNKSGKVGLLAYQRHYSPVFRRLRDSLQGGKYGKLLFVNAVLGQQWKRLTKGTWRQVPELSGGGQLNDSGSHVVDVLMWATGLEPESVSAFCDNRGAPVDIDSTVAIRFKGGAFGSISVLGDFPAWHEDWTIYCEKAGFLIRDGKLTVIEDDGSRWVAESMPGGSHPDRNFVYAILKGEPVEATFENGQRVITITEAMWRSAAQDGVPVRL